MNTWAMMKMQGCQDELWVTVHPILGVTVTEALVLRPLLEDGGRITASIHILVSVDRMKQKCFQITTKRVRRSQQFQLFRVGRGPFIVTRSFFCLSDAHLVLKTMGSFWAPHFRV